MSDGIFCRMMQAPAPCYKVCEDELTFTFFGIFPVSEGHLLIIPKQHVENLYQIEPRCLTAISSMPHRLAAVIKEVLDPDGLTVVQSNGAAAGQTASLYPMHLIPPSRGSAMEIHSRTAGQLEARERITSFLPQQSALASSRRLWSSPNLASKNLLRSLGE